MNRRDLLTMIAAVTGTAMIGATRVMAYMPTETGENLFSQADIAFLDEVAETILPATDTPGAKAAGVGAFMTVFVSDCYTPEEQASFREGMEMLRAGAEARHAAAFEALSPEDRRALVQEIATEANRQAAVVAAYAEARRQQSLDIQPAADTAAEEVVDPDAPLPHPFTAIQQLVLFGFFTSEIGANEVLRYEPVPGEYIGDLDYDGEPAWAT